MKRHEVLAALAAAAGLSLATPASAGIAGNPDIAQKSLVELQQQVGQNDEAMGTATGIITRRKSFATMTAPAALDLFPRGEPVPFCFRARNR